jgi:hypothetical protein
MFWSFIGEKGKEPKLMLNLTQKIKGKTTSK